MSQGARLCRKFRTTTSASSSARDQRLYTKVNTRFRARSISAPPHTLLRSLPGRKVKGSKSCSCRSHHVSRETATGRSLALVSCRLAGLGRISRPCATRGQNRKFIENLTEPVTLLEDRFKDSQIVKIRYTRARDSTSSKICATGSTFLTHCDFWPRKYHQHIRRDASRSPRI